MAHSLGGLYARAYTARYPDQVAGLVLVDARQEDVTTELDQAGTPVEPGAVVMRAAPYLMRLGIGRLAVSIVGVGAVAGTDSFDRLSPDLGVVLKAQLLKPTLARAAVAEADSISRRPSRRTAAWKSPRRAAISFRSTSRR